jgi:subtilisin family serine protease
VKVQNYSGRGEEVDFVNFTGFLNGTSFAAPYTAGMIALLLQKNPNMTWLEAKEYLKMHSKDLETDGHDINTGWGVPIMGKPETMITMWIGKDYMSVDGRQVTLDQAPQIVKETGRTLVPVRAIAEAFGAKVEWDEKAKKITIVR